VSDVRGGGQLCLEQLVYFLTTYPARAHAMLDGQRVAREASSPDAGCELAYPWAAAGINISIMCARLVGVEGKSMGEKATSPYFKRSSAWALLRDEQTFNEFYCVVFDMMDAKWKSENATYMQFNAVLTSLREDLEQRMASETFAGIRDFSGAAFIIQVRRGEGGGGG
jgi:hypothetical protein